MECDQRPNQRTVAAVCVGKCTVQTLPRMSHWAKHKATTETLCHSASSSTGSPLQPPFAGGLQKRGSVGCLPSEPVWKRGPKPAPRSFSIVQRPQSSFSPPFAASTSASFTGATSLCHPPNGPTHSTSSTGTVSKQHVSLPPATAASLQPLLTPNPRRAEQLQQLFEENNFRATSIWKGFAGVLAVNTGLRGLDRVGLPREMARRHAVRNSQGSVQACLVVKFSYISSGLQTCGELLVNPKGCPSQWCLLAA